MVADVIEIAQAFPQHHVQHGVVERDIGAGLDGQIQIGSLGGVGATRIDYDQFHVGPRLARILDATEHDGMGEGGVGAGDEQAIDFRDVFVGAGRCIGAERKLVAADRARHAQARIGVDVVGTNQSLGQLVEDVVVLGQQLAGDVEGHRVGAVARDSVGETVGGVIERNIP